MSHFSFSHLYSVVKNPSANAGDAGDRGSISGSERSQGPYKEKNNTPKQSTSCISSEFKFLQDSESNSAAENLAHLLLNPGKT